VGNQSGESAQAEQTATTADVPMEWLQRGRSCFTTRMSSHRLVLRLLCAVKKRPILPGSRKLTHIPKIHTAAPSGLYYEWIGECPAGIYLQKIKISDPYWLKQDFLLRNPQFETPADPITGADQVSVPEISSPEISFSDQTPSTFETEQVFSRPLANGVIDISDPIPLANGLPTKNSPLFLANGAVPESSQPAVADFSFPDWPSPNDKFVVERSRKQTAGHRG